MGGVGSGRYWYFGGKDTTEDHRSIDVRRWKREGLLKPHLAFGWQWSRQGEVVSSINVRTEPGRVILTYCHRSGNEEWKDKSYPVDLDWTACNMGGKRPWFLCPTCGRRVAILYCSGIFACRHCQQLTYRSQREAPVCRAIRRADKIREKLGWKPGIANPDGWKPTGMHWKTFEKLTAQHDAFVQVSLTGIAKRFNF